MVNYTIEEVKAIMKNPNNIRNMSVIAHVDHGKSTLTDSLIAKAGLIAEHQAGKARFTDGRKDEQERGITIKSTGVTLYYELDQPYLINLIDSPGHVDFSAEVTAALRATDGALVVVDCVEGVCVQTETVLRQACQERIKSVLMINKLDRVVLEMQLDGEEIYRKFIRAIESVNQILGTYEAQELNPVLGQVAFGAGKDCWAFTIPSFARILAKRFNVQPEALAPKLWGEYYFNPETSRIQSESTNEAGKQLQRTFVALIIDPIVKACKAIMAGDKEFIQKFVQTAQIEFAQKDAQLTGKELLKLLMSRWLNAADALLEMVIKHLPSPKEAQQYRTACLYEGPLDDQVAVAMKECDPNGPLMIYISKFIPSGEKGHFYAFGRIFSGTVHSGQKVMILGPNYTPGKNEDLFEKNVTRTVVMMGSKAESLSEVPCGNTVALQGIDSLNLKSATVTSSPQAHKIRSMKFSVSPVVRVAVTVKEPKDLPKLIDGLAKLSATDTLVICSREENGDNVIACCGDLHAEICINDLKEYCKVPLLVKDPVVSYRETITQQSQPCMTKSTNKLNRLYGEAIPLHVELANEIDKGRFYKDDVKVRAQALTEYDWDKQEALRIWCFGPEGSGPNILTEQTTGIQNLQQIQPQMNEGWQWATKQGVMTEEPMRGMRVNLMDAKIHADPVHSGGGQILQAARKLFYACELSAQPRLQEPMFLSEITCPQQMVGQVYQCLSKRRGVIIEEQLIEGSPMTIVKGYLPVSESFGFAGVLREMTQGMAFPQCSFDHWENMYGDPLEIGSRGHDVVMAVRKRKGLKPEIPRFEEYNDKL